MKYTFIEQMVKEGQIRPEAAEIIYKDCTELLEKTGDAVTDFVGKYLPGVLTMAAGAAVIGGSVGVYGAVRDSRAKSQIEAIKSSIIAHPSIDTKDKDKAAARFDEICRYAPGLAINEPVMQKLVHSKYKTGLTDHDVTSLIGIQVRMTPNPYTYAEKSQQYMPKVSSDNSKELMPKTAASKAGDMLANVHIALEKTGAFREIMERVLQQATAPLVVAGAVGTVAVGKGLWDAFSMKQSLKKSFNTAMAASPNGILAENPDKARAAFDTLAHFSPDIASEPHAAHAFMNKLVDYSLRSGQEVSPDLTDLKNLTEVQRNMGGAKGTLDHLQSIMSMSGIGGALSYNPKTWEKPTPKEPVPPIPKGFNAPLHYHS